MLLSCFYNVLQISKQQCHCSGSGICRYELLSRNFI